MPYAEFKSDLKKLVQNIEGMKTEISRLQCEKCTAEMELIEHLMDFKKPEVFTINWRVLNRYLFS